MVRNLMLVFVLLSTWHQQQRVHGFDPTIMSASVPATSRRSLVLIGGGHAHVQVVKALKFRPANIHVTLIDVSKSASYSGMVPGCIAGLYTAEQTLLHFEPLCEWANVDFIHDEVVDIDLENHCVHLRSRTDDPIPFHAVSLDIGSKSRGLDDIPGASEHTIPTRPISTLVQRVDEAQINLGEITRVVVVGGGAAGIELAMSIRGRWGPLLGDNLFVTLLDAGDDLLPNESQACREAVRTALKDRGIEVKHQCQVQRVTASNLFLESGESIPKTHCIWAAGAAAHSLTSTLKRRSLAVSDHGWIRVNDNLQSISHPCVFAVGDCCTIEGLPDGRSSPPKAGVYAVRAGPVLTINLPAFLQSEPLESYCPQDDFLKLIACGDGTAIGFRFGLPFQGKWVFEMKDSIDQMFMNLFKKENLTENFEKDSAKTQFDASLDEDRARLTPDDAAALLQRTDNEVEYKAAWHTIRTITQDERYRKAVIACIGKKKVLQEPFC